MPSQTTLPSGAVVTASPLRVQQADRLANPRPVKGGDPFGDVLSECVEVLDRGPYVQDADKPFDWTAALTCDRLVAMVAVRVATYGSTYAFDVKCPVCAKRYGWEVDLLADFPVVPVPAASIAAFRDGRPLEVPFRGRRLAVPLATGRHEVDRKKPRPEHQLSDAACSRIIAVDGVAGSRAFVEGLSMPDVLDLIEALDTVDGGIDTDLQTVCTDEACGAEADIILPFGREFYFPKRVKKSPPSAR